MARTFDMVLSIHSCGWVVAWFSYTVGGLPVYGFGGRGREKGEREKERGR